ncbi:hypothetical protein E4634_19870 [Mangrovimicrobium sediminis]|uniref:Uracil-DNA glycosylase-like domain-containing protein n=1 Tax=Mangrovimicrobium sediminis TaxID=2562682 RepID=A0A4Z0LUP0_9GAMM|nr:uracil-DNA glycosylase family protein [Haliea sp. SAOS-164]TGD71103.1 hypothetical protein E4634_19870 [Haliea sp. SAOS-164]
MLENLEKRMTQCRLCAGTLSKYGVVPRPIFSGGAEHPVFLLGQAPGITEYEKNAPFQGGAGQSIKALFKTCGLDDFDRLVYQTSVTKCFPGRRKNSSTDRMPSVGEVANCLPFLEKQMKIVSPKLLVCLGGLSWKAFLKLKETDEPGYCLAEIGITKPSEVKVPDVVGRQFKWRSTIVLPMIHPAGSANGARAQYPNHDRDSKLLLKDLLSRVGMHGL